MLSALNFGFLVFNTSSCGGSELESNSISNSFPNSSSESVISSELSIDDNSHKHDWVEIERTNVTCTEDGVITYVCVECEEIKDIVFKEYFVFTFS